MSEVSGNFNNLQSASSMEASQLSGELHNLNTTYHLDGRNYLQWSQLVKTFLKGRGKISLLTRDSPKENDPKFQAWDEEDSMIMSWLWNSMQPSISKNFMFLPTAHDIWESAQKTYSKMKDAAVLYEIKTKITNTKQ
ncbi:uncharacterized protein LOC120257437 [Dioscorea cayenensis subsp. rotundata]|uniref:Uncharacterized protein LOC120257437 n=1 Tax=Dioscorea cayennensis subsp. rotundata TaxID=55577 RepID=A0AB40B2R4_DIOCR|nr:uncharacterized protein LOC120257437 [Dioscorea cayenensis subsp. rotundata]